MMYINAWKIKYEKDNCIPVFLYAGVFNHPKIITRRKLRTIKLDISGILIISTTDFFEDSLCKRTDYEQMHFNSLKKYISSAFQGSLGSSSSVTNHLQTKIVQLIYLGMPSNIQPKGY